MGHERNVNRREFLAPWSKTPKAEPPPADWFRPPGALPDVAFLATCGQSGRCVASCPEQAIVALGPAYGNGLEGTPALFPRARACILCEDLPCINACPTAALRSVPLKQVRMGLAQVDPNLCFAERGQPCDYCARQCPVGESALRLEEGRPVVYASACTGCGQCVYVCPTTPGAITILPL